jgi:hypothetical protein
MKSILLSSVFLFAAVSSSFAATDDLTPIVPKTTVIAEVLMTPGFVANPHFTGVRIHSNGEVYQFSYPPGRPDEETQTDVASLKPQTLSRLIKSIQAIQYSELVDLDPGKPMCVDLPSYQYDIRHLDGTQIEIFRKANCHEYGMKNGQGGSLLKVLDGLFKLTEL